MARRLRRPTRRSASSRLAVAVAVVTGVLLATGAPAAASCATDDLSRLAPAADVALVGTVTSVDGGTARLRVSDVWRGAPGAVVDVDGGDPSVSTAVAWETDRQYAVLARRSGAGLSTDVCAGTRPVDDASLVALDSALGPATPLGRGAGTPAEGQPGPPSSTPSATDEPADDTSDASGEPAAADGDGDGLSTPELAAGILLGLAVLASFLLPQLRRHNRERRRERREGTDDAAEPPEPDDPADTWRR